jgi:hypothetical protein
LKTKRCKSCKAEKPVSQFYTEHKGLVCGGTAYRPRCKACCCAQDRAYAAKKKKKNGRPLDGHKIDKLQIRKTQRLLAW